MMNRAHNNTEPSVVVADQASGMNREELGHSFPEAVDIQDPGGDGEHARPEKRQKVGAADDDLKKPAAIQAPVDKASDATASMLLSSQSLTPIGTMTSSDMAGSASSRPLHQAMNPPPGFLPQQQQPQVSSL